MSLLGARCWCRGDGAGRREVGDLIDALIWVQSDEREVDGGLGPARRIADAIDGANMPADGSPPDDAGWMAEEIPFNTAQRTVGADADLGTDRCGVLRGRPRPSVSRDRSPAATVPQSPGAFLYLL